MVDIKDEKDCCGCWACANACPKHCITMVEDNEGFRYPRVNIDECVNCGICENACPVINVKPEIEKSQRAFVAQHKDEKILMESTSGGAFTAIATWVINQGGVVFGAAFDKKYEVCHQYAESIEDIAKFRNSKYVQSLIGDAYAQAKHFLLDRRLVLFSGTACQLEGLVCFLHKPYENLIMSDVVCRAVPSPLVLRKYLDFRGRENMSSVKFRDKFHGYKYSSLRITGASNRDYHEGIDTDPYLRSFFCGINIRPSCTDCRFRKRYRISDFTLWDCFDVYKFSKNLDNDKGVTRILAHTEKAQKILKELSDSLIIEEKPADEIVAGVREMKQSALLDPRRERFFKDLNSMALADCFAKYFPNTLRHRFEKCIRLISNRLGIYCVMKLVFKAVLGDRQIKR